jgi:plasmid stability protein
MPNLNLKNIPPGLYERLRHSASLHRRSLNSEAIVCLELALMSTPVDPEDFLARLDQIHQRLHLSPLTGDLLARAKSEGRP